VSSAPVALTDRAQLLVVRDRGVVPYAAMFAEMRAFTDQRTPQTPDELWLVEHPPVYTLGTNDRNEPFDNPDNIPVVHSDRGGQITYHGPGQLIAYVLIDLRRRSMGVKALVSLLEQGVIDLLVARGLHGERRAGAPGVYVAGRKLAQLGLRVRQKGSYHGLSLNVAMDHAPFRRIKPCGYAGLETVDLAQLCGPANTAMAAVKQELVACLRRQLDDNRHESNTIPPASK
jgi:lipoyl(octanoyl) transferase